MVEWAKKRYENIELKSGKREMAKTMSTLVLENEILEPMQELNEDETIKEMNYPSFN